MASWHSSYPMFPPSITRTGLGKEFKTDIEETVGNEYRDEVWADGRWRFSLGGLKFLASQIDGWIAFTESLKGAAGLCLYAPKSSVFEIDQEEIGIGDGVETEFQLQKQRTYAFGGPDPEPEIITHPWHDYPNLTFPQGQVALPSANVRIFLDGVEKTLTTHFTVNRDTGVITFLSAPGNGVIVTASCKYLVLCRFEGDYAPVETESGTKFEISAGVQLVQPKGGS